MVARVYLPPDGILLLRGWRSMMLWPNSGLSGGSDGTGRVGKGKAAVVLVLLL